MKSFRLVRVSLLARFSLCVGMLAAASLALHGQDAQPTSPAPQQSVPMKAAAPTRESITEHEHKKYEEFVRRFNLTPDQQTQVKAVLDNRLSEELAIFEESPRVKEKRLKEINVESQGKMRAILNDDQRAKYNKGLQDEADRIAARKAAKAGTSSAAPSTPTPPQQI